MASSGSNSRSLEQLTDSEKQRVHNFREVTSVDDVGLAIDVLRSKEWNLEQAIQAFFEPGYVNTLVESSQAEVDDELSAAATASSSQTQAPVAGGASSSRATAATRGESQLRQRTQSDRSSQTRNDGTSADDGLEQRRRAAHNCRAVKPAFGWMPLFTWPFSLSWRVTLYFVKLVLSLVGQQRIADEGVPGGHFDGASIPASSSSTALLGQRGETPDSGSHGPLDDAAQLAATFESQFGTAHPPFFHGTYAQALDVARREFKYLVVVLWSMEHDDSAAMGQVLTHPDIVSYLSQPRFVLWMGDVTRSEAYHVASTLQAAAYPFIALAALKFQTTAGSVAGLSGRFRLQVVTRIDGLPSADTVSSDAQTADNGLPPHVNGVTRSLLSLISGPVERHDQALNAARREQEERDAARRLREQQDEAYHASLARDREREREAQEQAERDRAEKEQEQERKLQEQKHEEALCKWRWATLAQILREEQDTADASVSSGGCKLNLRLDNGHRIVKVFPEDATMQQLFDFVETREVAGEWDASKTTPFGDDIDAIDPPTDYKHEYEFSLVSQFPRVVFDDRTVGLKEALTPHRLWPTASLIVEPKFENEDDE
ncbi:hypothetical protein DL89DRAFT_267829 [Linderina pennispora]|uniref:UBX domain-containing protein n=1 Tax=Linderina pennispora TaxID=61395 RepID=A0A1Y1W7X8_9FUNG|nr:uncharacterized protein DL89DRAFT_267829 [Linderina pennispora]ORX69643.1 hypothetical protein DL89DRAFT_267829 [Linderina pennispora]